MLYVIQTALELGFMYALVAMALFLSYRILDIADMTTDSGFVLGAAVSVTCSGGRPSGAGGSGSHGVPGACAGYVTAFLQTRTGRTVDPGRDHHQYGALHRESYGHGLELQCEPLESRIPCSPCSGIWGSEADFIR